VRYVFACCSASHALHPAGANVCHIPLHPLLINRALSAHLSQSLIAPSTGVAMTTPAFTLTLCERSHRIRPDRGFKCQHSSRHFHIALRGRQGVWSLPQSTNVCQHVIDSCVQYCLLLIRLSDYSNRWKRIETSFQFPVDIFELLDFCSWKSCSCFPLKHVLHNSLNMCRDVLS